jgi:hypothetical protein
MPEGSEPTGAGAAPPKSPPQEQSSGIELVSPEQIFAETDTQTPVHPGTWTQRAGMRLAAGVGSLGALVTLIIVVRWIWLSSGIPNPTISPSLTPENVDALLKNYKALHDQAFQSASQMFDTVVVKALLPVFTSILGYIFGARSTSDSNQQ